MKEKLKKITIIIISLIIGLSVLYYRYQQDKKQEENYINNIKNEINTIKENVNLSGSLNGNNLNVEIKNLGNKNILGLRFFVEFENIFGEKLVSCEGNCYSDNYNYTTNIEIQKNISSNESYTLNKNYIFGKKKGNLTLSKIDKINFGEDIKISKIFVYEIVFDNNTKINLSGICNNNMNIYNYLCN